MITALFLVNGNSIEKASCVRFIRINTIPDLKFKVSTTISIIIYSCSYVSNHAHGNAPPINVNIPH